MSTPTAGLPFLGDLVQVRIANPSSDTRYRPLAITGNRVGFNNKYASQIFGVFKRLHGREQYNGTGLNAFKKVKVLSLKKR